MTNQYPWSSNTTPPIASQDDPRYETPGGAQNKIESYVAKTHNIGDLQVTQPKIAIGAVGAFQLDPSLLPNFGDIAVQAEFERIKQSKFVTYEMFGAQLDVYHDSTAAIQAAHAFANLHGLPVRQGSGTIRLLDTVQVMTDTDLSGCKIILDDEANGKTLFEMQTDYPLLVATGIVQSELTEGAFVIPSLAAYPNCLIVIQSSEVFGYRGGNISQPIFKEEVLTHIRDGSIIGGGLQNNFTSGTLTIYYKKMTEKPVEFRGLNIEWNFSDGIKACTVIRNERCNSTITGVNIEVTNPNALNNAPYPGQYKGTIMSVLSASNVTIDKIKGQNITGNTGSLSSYVLSSNYTVGMTLQGSNLLNGWGIMGSNHNKNFVVRDSTINRIDCHIGTGDTLLDNVHLVGAWGAHIGWGKGIITLRNCTSEYIRGIDEGAFGCSVYLRADWGNLFSGEIHHINHTVINRDNVDFTMIKMTDSYPSTANTLPINLPSIFIKDLMIESNYNVKTIGFAISLPNYVGRDMKLPEYVVIDGVTIKGENDTKYFQACSLAPQSNLFAADTAMRMTLRGINHSVYSKFLTGFSSAELVTPLNYQFNKKLVEITDSVIPTAARYILDISNCAGGLVLTAVHDTTINNSKITAMLTGDASHTKSLKVYDSELYPYNNSSATNLFLQVANGIFKDNVVTCLKKDGGYLPLFVSYISDSKVLQNNFLVGNAESETTANWLKNSLLKISGSTASRPTVGLFVGYPYFDTTLGKQIWYNGSVWKDATSTTV